MNRTFRSLAVGLLGVDAAVLGLACSSGNNPGNYGDACTVYAVGPSCTGELLCKLHPSKRAGLLLHAALHLLHELPREV